MPEPDALEETPLAYFNSEFLKSPEARIIRIISEYMEPSSRFRRHRVRDTIVFFGSARSVPPEVAAAKYEAIQEEIKRGGGLTPELENAQMQAEYGVKLARYYNAA